ncbi:sulfotransferase domain-containing protein [Puniceicoccales bacterium CK1056]|uniref:Sulfotransferase domain-containing protein n=1 Tax=Oceanipulchritudo coccoides TaxID=2706888 RepID=A0A6B2M2L4_9BACT|nr:sulfotransferase [Oceanipulchritudo coccoides]NDV62317.1 sulfotransferase domain-containing protein [Oceanipulchritudo coccoides]
MAQFRVNLVIIGVGKAGTTSLAKWLSDLDECCFSEPKETMFFGSDRLFEKGIDWYQNTFFPHYAGESLVAEATPAYSIRAQCGAAAERIHEHNPQSKIIYMVRDPLARCVSAWKMWASLEPTQSDFGNHLITTSKKGFNNWLRDPVVYKHMVLTSSYRYQLEAWQLFPKEQQHVIFLEDLKERKTDTLNKVSNFLELAPGTLEEASRINYNTGENRSQKTPFRRRLEESSLWNSVKGLVPGGLKAAVAESNIGSKPIKFGNDDWETNLRAKFLQDISEDNIAFLKDFGKPAEFWTRT